MWAVVGVSMLAIPLTHAILGHSLLGRLGRVLQPRGVPVSPTPHEQRHARRSRPVRISATVAWLALLAVAASLVLSGCDSECTGHGGWYLLSHGIFYCNDGSYDYG
jgi:hypothetical protein